MYQETRITLRDADNMQISSRYDTFGADGDEKVVRLSLTKVLTNGTDYMSSDINLTIGLETAILIIQKLQEGVDGHENKA